MHFMERKWKKSKLHGYYYIFPKGSNLTKKRRKIRNCQMNIDGVKCFFDFEIYSFISKEVMFDQPTDYAVPAQKSPKVFV